MDESYNSTKLKKEKISTNEIDSINAVKKKLNTYNKNKYINVFSKFLEEWTEDYSDSYSKRADKIDFLVYFEKVPETDWQLIFDKSSYYIQFKLLNEYREKQDLIKKPLKDFFEKQEKKQATINKAYELIGGRRGSILFNNRKKYRYVKSKYIEVFSELNDIHDIDQIDHYLLDRIPEEDYQEFIDKSSGLVKLQLGNIFKARKELSRENSLPNRIKNFKEKLQKKLIEPGYSKYTYIRFFSDVTDKEVIDAIELRPYFTQVPEDDYQEIYDQSSDKVQHKIDYEERSLLVHLYKKGMKSDINNIIKFIIDNNQDTILLQLLNDPISINHLTNFISSLLLMPSEWIENNSHIISFIEKISIICDSEFKNKELSKIQNILFNLKILLFKNTNNLVENEKNLLDDKKGVENKLTEYEQKIKQLQQENNQLNSAVNILREQNKSEVEQKLEYKDKNDKLTLALDSSKKKIELLIQSQPVISMYYQDIFGNPVNPEDLPKSPPPITKEEKEAVIRPYKGRSDDRDSWAYIKEFYTEYIPQLNPKLEDLPKRFWPLAQNELFKMEPNLRSSLEKKGKLSDIPSSTDINKDKQETVRKILNISTEPCNYESVESFMKILKQIKSKIYLACKNQKK